jgi:hypothetical protein
MSTVIHVFLHIKEIWPKTPYVGCLLRKNLNPLNTTKMGESIIFVANSALMNLLNLKKN